MNVIALPAFGDNYIWMLHDGVGAAVVDPGDAKPVIEALQTRRLRLQAILVTHHHPDHVGGIAALRDHLDGPVYGPALERIPQPCEPLSEGDERMVLGQRVQVLDVPGHTAGHIAYVLPQAPGGPWLFCGDTLFSAGCGRLFEGTPAQMLRSLRKLQALPPETRVCCAHEYTLANLRFAQAVEPGNPAIAQAIQRVKDLRAQGLPSLPSTMAEEARINPFLRTQEAFVAERAREQGALDNTEAAVFAALREWKNRF
jgi:hydroxyacylglutathione hydrolase